MRALAALTAFVSLAPAVSGQNAPAAGPNTVTDTAKNESRNARKYLADGEYSKAETSLRALLRTESDPRKATATKLTLADLLREEGRVRESGVLFSQVLEAKGIEPRERMNALSGLADIDCHDGDMESSSAKWNETLALAREYRDTVDEANALRGFGVCWIFMGQASRAEPLLRRALRMLDDNPQAYSWDKASVLAAMAQSYRDAGKPSLAEDALTLALELDRPTLGEAHPQVAFLMEQLAVVLASTNRFDLARTYALKAEKIMNDACGGDSLAVASSLAIEGEVELRANDASGATSKFALALSIVRRHSAPRPFTVKIMQAYSSALKLMHRQKEANVLNEEINSLLKKPS